MRALIAIALFAVIFASVTNAAQLALGDRVAVALGKCPFPMWTCPDGACSPPWSGCPVNLKADGSVSCRFFECNGQCMPPWAGPCSNPAPVPPPAPQPQPPAPAGGCPHLRFPCNGGCIPPWACCNCDAAVRAQCPADKFFCAAKQECRAAHESCE